MSLDILDVIEAVDLYVLPPAAVAVVLGALIRGGRAPIPADAGEDEARRLDRLDRERAVRRIGLLNYGLALRSLSIAVPEVQSYFALGGFRLFPVVDIALPVVFAVVNLGIGLGLRRLRLGARWAEVAWNGLVAAIALMWSAWVWGHGGFIDWRNWPDFTVSRVLPVFLVVVMFLPRTAAVVSAEHRALIARTLQVGGRPPTRRSIVGAFSLGFLVIVGTVVVLNVLDWVFRVRFEFAAMLE
jgi:hypothetical protein